MIIKEKFKEIRTQLNISQSEMAKKLGIKQSYYSAIERGEKEPSDNVLNMLFDHNNVNRVWFYEDRGNVFNLNPIPKDPVSRDQQLKKAIKQYKIEAKQQKEKLFSELKSENEELITLYKELQDLDNNVSILTPITQNYLNVYDPEDTTEIVSYFSDSIGIAPYEDYRKEIFDKLNILHPHFGQIKALNKAIAKFLSEIRTIGIDETYYL